jgi:hypothetical protein
MVILLFLVLSIMVYWTVLIGLLYMTQIKKAIPPPAVEPTSTGVDIAEEDEDEDEDERTLRTPIPSGKEDEVVGGPEPPTDDEPKKVK